MTFNEWLKAGVENGYMRALFENKEFQEELKKGLYPKIKQVLVPLLEEAVRLGKEEGP